MIALARKYRPRNFASVAVQSHVSNTLKGAIARGRVAHGYLLCGPRGVGKTTLARVLAMALNCENKQSDGEPCGECPSCTRIWSGGASLDVVEIDAASNRGVDDARDLRERAMYAPSGDDRFKVYIVDEAHMLTREAWNALLKILEEPPPRVVFVFATTEPQKIAQAAAPVLSRLQRFDLKRIGASDIRERLASVLTEEEVHADADALAMIARAADGSMRDALSLTDQVLALGDGDVTTVRVREALGLVAEDEYIAILDIIAERRAADVFGAVARLAELGVDLGQFLAGLSDMLRAQLALALGAKDVDVSTAARDALEQRRDRMTPGDLLRMLNAVGELEPRFRRSTQQQLLLETLLVRFALLDRTLDLEAVLREMGGGGGSGGGGGGSSGAVRPTPGGRPNAPSGALGGRDGGYRGDAPRRSDTPVETPRVHDTPRAMRESESPRVAPPVDARASSLGTLARAGDGLARLNDGAMHETLSRESASRESAPRESASVNNASSYASTRNESPRARASRDGDGTPRDTAGTPRDTAGTPRDAAGTPRDAAGTPRDTASAARDTASAPRDTATPPRDHARPSSPRSAATSSSAAPARSAPAREPSSVATLTAPNAAFAAPTNGKPAIALDLNALVAEWDDIVVAIRRERPIVGALLEHAIPSGVSASGVITLQIDDAGTFEGLAAKSRDLSVGLTAHVPGLTRVQLLPPDTPERSASPQRMTAESVKSDTLLAIRKRDPVLAAAIDELDLDLI